MTITAFQMLWNEISPLLVKLSRLRAQSYMIFDALGGIYLQNAFPSSIIHINPFSYKSKTTSSERKYFFSLVVSHAILQNAH